MGAVDTILSLTQPTNRAAVTRSNAPAVRIVCVSDDRRDKTQRGQPTHSPDQQLHHAADFPLVSAIAPDKGRGAETTSVKKEPRRVRAGQDTRCGVVMLTTL